MSEQVQEIFIDKINDPQDAMRTELNRDGLWELAENIKANGLINPITVRPKGDRYEVVAGHRRLSACKIAGMIKIACVVRQLDEQATFSIMAAENLVREDVDPVDEAVFIKRYMDKTGATIEAVAGFLKRSVKYVEDRLAVGSMPQYLQEHLKNGRIKLGAALALNQIEDDSIRHMWVELAVRDGVSVRQAEYWLVQWRMNQLPSEVRADEALPNAAPGEYKPMMFECAVDGQKYNIADIVTIMVYKGNVPYIDAIRSELSVSHGDPTLSPQE